ncbi:hypothetical protein GFY24_32980 [Nocardia sp. SYP-A9097]|nr:hypothetical protein [Nocardia sp. SYP-A9097]
MPFHPVVHNRLLLSCRWIHAAASIPDSTRWRNLARSVTKRS